MKIAQALIALLGGLWLAACAPLETPPIEPADGPVLISLERSVCFGFCPDYTVTINEAGDVHYVGRRSVNVVGEQRATIPRADVLHLLNEFDRIGFSNLRNEYRANVSDLPTYTVTLTRGGVTKTVVDFGGPGAGMPESVRALQDEIDRVANTAQWVLRNGEPVRDRR
jgi:Domain of unknown function (DUF6438)